MALSFETFQRRASLALSRRRPGPLGLDFHNHLLPGVDDGMKNFAEAKTAVSALAAAGFTGAVITPHIHAGVYDNFRSQLRQNFAAFVTRLQAEGENFPLHLAAEYFADEHFLNLIHQGELLSLQVGQERWVLVEFPYHQETPFTGICLSALAARGYRPVIAHVERYNFVARAPAAWLARFANLGAILQGDIGSLAGQHGEHVRRFAHWLTARNLVPIWGTDLHQPSQMEPFIKRGLRHLPPPQRLNKLLAPVREPLEELAETCA
jgi:tyrosine-protein phosphatase YwqE